MKTDRSFSPRINISGTYFEGDTLWFTNLYDAYLYKMNLENGYVQQVVSLLKENDMQMPFYDILVYKDFFVFVPCKSNHILLLNRMNWSREYIMLPQVTDRIGETQLNFFTGIIYGECLYLFGFSYPGILKLNMLTREFVLIDDWVGKLQFISSEDGCLHVNYYRLGNVIYFPFENSNAVMVFDLESERADICVVGDSGQRYFAIEYVNKDFWLIPRDASTGKIVRWNPVFNKVQYYGDFPVGFDYTKHAFFQTLNIKDQIFLFAHVGNMNICIDTRTGQMQELAHLYSVSDGGCKYPCVKKHHDKIYAVLNDKYICCNSSLEKVREVPYTFDDMIYKRYEKEEIDNLFKKMQINNMKESVNVNLEKYLKYIYLK